MKADYLLPHKYKITGWVLFLLGLAFGIFSLLNDYETHKINITVLSFFNDNTFLKIIKNDVFEEILALLIILGGLIIGFSKEKIEDEYVYKLRKDSLVWAIVFNYTVLTLAILFIYNMTFIHILIFNMFTPLLFFIIRFNFIKWKSQNHEE